MGIPVLVLGESGTGKSASMRNFSVDDLKVINVANKPLPFKNKFESVSTDDYRKIIAELKLNKKKVTVIDDAQYLMANEFMRRATERGYDKFTEIAQNFWNLVNCVKDLPADHIVYFMAHIERDQNGNEKIKTIGKLLDEKITVEGMFTIVLKTNVTDGTYSFLTQNSGHDTVKSPIGMFGSYAIDNDLKYVDEKIRNYYEIGEFLSDDEMAEIDKEAEKVDFEPRQEGEKKSRKSRRTKETVDNDSESTTEQPAATDDAEPTTGRRRRRVSDDMAEEREAVKAENEEAVANIGADDEREEIPFSEVEMPETKELPRRKRREAVDTINTPPMTDVPEPSEEPAPTRRRRRR